MNPRPDAEQYPRFSRHWPALAAVALLAAVSGWMVASAMGRNGGKWIYPLDDAYIHLATVKHLVQHGVWGISYLNGFSSCLSSLLYPLLLAGCYLIFGVNESALLVLNGIASAAVIFYAGALVQRHTRSNLYTFIVLACAVLLTPLPVVAVGGMEHTWQTLIDLWLLDLAVHVLDPQEPPDVARRAARWLPVAACLAVMIRFEGLFFVAIVGLLLLCRGRFWLAVGVGVAAALPLAIFGAYSVSKGWSFLPNSVLMKSGGSHSRGLLFGALAVALLAGLQWPRAARWLLAGAAAVAALTVLLPGPRARLVHAFGQFGGTLLDYAHLGILLLALTAALHAQWRRHGTLWSRVPLLLGMLWVVTLQHLLFAGVGWLYRYEAYLMFLGIVAVGIAVADALPAPDAAGWRGEPPGRVAVWLGLAILCIVPLAVRAGIAYRLVPQASHNIYGQQYQMARFARRFYNGAGVAANDIGAIDFFADLRVLDTYGLADRDVFRARRQEDYNQETIRRLAAKDAVRLVMVYDGWATDFCGPLPEWVPVGQWTIPNNVICGFRTVSFYAPDAAQAPRLIHALQEFAPELPADTVQSGAYRGEPPPHVLGAFDPPQDDAGGRLYTVPQMVRFYLDPLKGRPPSATGTTSGAVSLGIYATPQLQAVDVVLNGETVATWTPTEESPGQWTPLTARVRWREGENVLAINGHGTAAFARDKTRTPLFAVREPAWKPETPAAP